MPSSMPRKRSQLTSLLPLLSSARPLRSRLYQVTRRPMPRHLKTWARSRRRCRLPSSRWNRRRQCRRRLTAHESLRSPRTQPRRQRSMTTNCASSRNRIEPGPLAMPSSMPRKRSQLTSLLPLLSSARPLRSRLYRVIRRPMPRHLKTWARSRRRCRLPSSRWNRRRHCRRRLTAHLSLRSPRTQPRRRSVPTSLPSPTYRIGSGTSVISRPLPRRRSRFTSLRPQLS